MKINITGVEELEAELTRMSDIEWAEIWDHQGLEMMEKADIYTPFRTGELRQSANFSVDTFGYEAEYAPDVNYGHRTRSGSFVPGQHFLEQIVAGQDESYKNEVLKHLKEK
jgi:hypothetical protein